MACGPPVAMESVACDDDGVGAEAAHCRASGPVALKWATFLFSPGLASPSFCCGWETWHRHLFLLWTGCQICDSDHGFSAEDGRQICRLPTSHQEHPAHAYGQDASIDSVGIGTTKCQQLICRITCMAPCLVGLALCWLQTNCPRAGKTQPIGRGQGPSTISSTL